MIEKETAIKLEHVSKTFWIRDKKPQSLSGSIKNMLTGGSMRKIEAVKDVSVQIKRGEFFGIVGANGCGKSTLLNLMSGVYRPDKGGQATIHGDFMRLTLGLGFNQEMTARENVFVNASIMGLTFREIHKKFNKIIRFAELEKFVDTKIKYFSRGMKARLGFAVAIHANPKILLLDEIFGGVGDAKFRAKSEDVFKKQLIEGRTIVLVSHNLGVIKDHAERVMFMHKGKCLKIDGPEEIFKFYKEKHNLKELKMQS